jgi:hypothetical protein
MGRLYVVIRRNGSKRFIGAIPARRGVTVSQLKKVLPSQIKKGFSAKIVSSKTLKRIILKQRPRRVKRRKRRTKK